MSDLMDDEQDEEQAEEHINHALQQPCDLHPCHFAHAVRFFLNSAAKVMRWSV